MATVDVPGPLTRWVIAPTIIGMAMVVGVVGLHGASDATTAGYQAIVQHSQDPAEVARSARYHAIVDQLRAAIPEGATVFVPQTTDLNDPIGVEWSQRLPEMALMQGHDVVADPAKADYVLRVAQTGARAALIVEKSR